MTNQNQGEANRSHAGKRSTNARRKALGGGGYGAARCKAGPGRATGWSNKTTGQAKDNIALAFEMMGGDEGLLKWARRHPAEFYCNVYPKLISVILQVQSDEAPKEAEESGALERLLVNIYDSMAAEKLRKLSLTGPDPRGGPAPYAAVTHTNGPAAPPDKRSG
jgi:hypothetical protein